MNFFIAILLAIIAHILTFLQLQGNIKWGFYAKYPIITLLVSIPISFLFIKSVEIMVIEFNGHIWPSRLIGFGVGIIIFSLMGYVFFGETVTPKTITSLFLAFLIIIIQLFWK